MVETTIEISDIDGLDAKLDEFSDLNNVYINSNLNFGAIVADSITVYKNTSIGYDNEDNIPTFSADTALDVSGKLIVTDIDVSENAIIRGNTVIEVLDISTSLTVYGDATFKSSFTLTDLIVLNTMDVPYKYTEMQLFSTQVKIQCKHNGKYNVKYNPNTVKYKCKVSIL